LSIHQNRWLRLSSDSRQTNGSVLRERITNPHHAIDKNGVYLKNTTFSCIKWKYYIYQLFFVEGIRTQTHSVL